MPLYNIIVFRIFPYHHKLLLMTLIILHREILLTQLCSEFDNSAKHITSIDLLDAQVKLSEISNLAHDPKKVLENVEVSTLEEAKLIEHQNTDHSIDTGLEVEETKTYK